jgi:MFS family permease
MQPTASTEESGRFPALRHRDFRTLWLGMLFASGTIAFQYYAQMWLIYSLTDSALLLGILGATRGAAMLLFGLYGGALADRMDRRLLLLATEALALLVNALLGILALSGAIELWHAFTLIFIGAAVGSVDAPIRQAIVPELVPTQYIPNAVALTTAAQLGSFALVPVLAGFVIDALGPGGAYLLSTVGNVGVMVALLALRYRGRSTRAGREPVLRTVRDGLRYARSHPTILWIIAVTFTTSAFGMSLYQGLIAKWASEVLGLRPGPYGVLASVWGIGTLVTAYALAFRAEMPHKGRILVWGSIVFGLSFALFAFSRWLPLAGFAYLVNGAAWTGASIAGTALVQSAVPNEFRGRVMSLFMINGAVAQLNGVTLGAIADRVGMEVLVPGSTLLCSVLLIGMALTVPALRQLDRLSSPRASG